jgi:predicted metalloprotease with PDZ domain
MDDIAEKLAIRDSFLRKRAAAHSPDELMREMWRMQQASWERLKRIPEAWNSYQRQQFKQRAINVRPEYLE